MNLSDTSKRMVLVMSVLTAVIIGIGAVYYRSLSVFPFGIGVVLGAAVNSVKIIMLERAVQRVVIMDEKNAGNYMRNQYLIRFALTGLGLVLAVKAPFINLWGMVAGILTMQIATLYIKSFIMKSDQSRDE